MKTTTGPKDATPFLVSRTRYSFLHNLAITGVVILFGAAVADVPLHTVLTVAIGYTIACGVAGGLIFMRDAWFKENEDLMGEMSDHRLSLHWNSTGKWTVLDETGREVSYDRNWNVAVRVALDEYDSELTRLGNYDV